MDKHNFFLPQYYIRQSTVGADHVLRSVSYGHMLQMSRILKLPHKSTLKEMVTLMHSSEAACPYLSEVFTSSKWSVTRRSCSSFFSFGSCELIRFNRFCDIKIRSGEKQVSPSLSKLRKRSSSSLFRYTINCALTTTFDISPRRLRRRAIRSQ